jgi:hypothetical protein
VADLQGTVNLTFLSGGVWPGLRRAAGTLLDANAYGSVAALAGPIAFVSIPYLGIRHARVAQAVALALNWAGRGCPAHAPQWCAACLERCCWCMSSFAPGGATTARENARHCWRALPSWCCSWRSAQARSAR